jgi:hypothetical protein
MPMRMTTRPRGDVSAEPMTRSDVKAALVKLSAVW